MDIEEQEETEIVTVEPLVDPVPRREPVREPLKAPEREKVPA